MSGRSQSDEEMSRVLRAMTRPLRARLLESGRTQGELAVRVGYDRSRVSRALSGRELVQLPIIEQIAIELGVDAQKTRRRWRHADAIRRRGKVARAGGGPPDGMSSYADMLAALRDLVEERVGSQRELVRRDRTGMLNRATVGALLRGQRSARRDTVAAIVAACGVSEVAAGAWDDAWRRLGQPYQRAQHQRRREGLRTRQAAEGWDCL